jgi:anti-sigma28 factor (negative regulator of flagellin synthesis)
VEIKGVTNGSFFVNATKNNKAESNQQLESKDKIEISSEARDLLKTELSAERVAELHQRISDGFYDSEDVLQKVADKLLPDIKI